MDDVQPDLRHPQGDYGLDGDFRLIPARWQAVIVAAITVALIALTVRSAMAGALIGAVVTGLLTLGLVLFVASYLWTTRAGKFEVWARILSDLRLRGDERVLDLGLRSRRAAAVGSQTAAPWARGRHRSLAP